MTDCTTVRERRLLDEPLGDALRAHVATCAACAADAPLVGALGRMLAADLPAEPPPGLHARVAAAAAPLLAARVRRPPHRAVVRAIVAALLPLPLVVLVDAWALRAIYGALTRVLPESLSFYLVVNHAALLALLCGLTYAAIALLAEHQHRPGREVLHHG